ncbi:uncharacterized protein ACNS7B_016063 isoform 2-T2 [Menidia menidia]
MGLCRHLLPPPKLFRGLLVISVLVTLIVLRVGYRSSVPASPSTVNLVLEKKCGIESIASGGASFVAVHGRKTLLVSAYLEHRTGKQEVRVISVALRGQSAAYRCLLCCGEELRASEASLHIHSHFHYPYGTGDITCPVPEGCQAPSHVAVTTPDAPESDGASPQDTPEPTLLEVMNQTPQRSLPYAHTLCISAMFNFTNVLQLVQSVEMLQLLGVDRVVVYNSSCSPQTQKVLEYYTKKGLMEVIPWTVSDHLNVSHGWMPSLDPGDLHYFGQIAALNDCLYRYMYRSKYTSLHDVDELILPQAVPSYSDLLPVLEKKYAPKTCFMFEHNLFPRDIERPPPNPQALSSQRCWENVPGVNVLAHLHQEPVIPTRENFKIIVNPRNVFTVTVHGVLEPQGGCAWVDRELARMYHTRSQKTREVKPEQLILDGRLLDYSQQLVPAVNAALLHSGLLKNECSQPGI